MQIVYFTLVAAFLYLLADRILLLIEARLGRRLEQRSLVFFALLLGMALASFSAIEYFVS
jgi:hypothetical protein